MDKSHPSSPERAPDIFAPPQPDRGIENLRETEAKILQMISAQAPIAKVLDEICLAADHQIGDVASYISRPEDDERELCAIATMVVYYRLHTFCCETVVGDSGQVFGFFKMLSGVPRRPTCVELATIEWAKSLAARAIKLDKQTSAQAICTLTADLPVEERVLEWSDSRQAPSACKSSIRTRDS